MFTVSRARPNPTTASACWPGTVDHLFFYSNRAEVPLEVEPGVHGLANHLLDTPWPKVVKGAQDWKP